MISDVNELNFDDLLYFSKLSKTELGRRMGVAPQTVSRWAKEPPTYVLTYLRQYVTLKEAWEAVK